MFLEYYYNFIIQSTPYYKYTMELFHFSYSFYNNLMTRPQNGQDCKIWGLHCRQPSLYKAIASRL